MTDDGPYAAKPAPDDHPMDVKITLTRLDRFDSYCVSESDARQLAQEILEVIEDD